MQLKQNEQTSQIQKSYANLLKKITNQLNSCRDISLCIRTMAKCSRETGCTGSVLTEFIRKGDSDLVKALLLFFLINVIVSMRKKYIFESAFFW